MPVDEQPGNKSAAEQAEFRILKLKATHEGFGRLIDYLSRIEPYAHHELGNFANALRHQLRYGCHLAAISGRSLVGYCGWLPTRVPIAEAWLQDKGTLRPVLDGNADAYAVTVVAAAERRLLTALIREVRKEHPRTRWFFKREYQDRSRPARKSSVANVTT